MKFLTVKEVAHIINVKPKTIYQWAKLGQIPCIKLNGCLRFDLDDINGRFAMDIIASNGTMVKQAIVNLKGTPVNLILDDYIPGLYQIHLYNEAHSYR